MQFALFILKLNYHIMIALGGLYVLDHSTNLT